MKRLARSYTNLIVAEIKIPHKTIGDFLEFPEERYYIMGYYTTHRPWYGSDYRVSQLRQDFLQCKEFRDELQKLTKDYKERHHFLTGVEIVRVSLNQSFWFPLKKTFYEPLSYYEKLGYNKFVNVFSMSEGSL